MDHKYSKDSQKASNINTYIFTNPAKLQVNRNTILHSDVQHFISSKLTEQIAWFVFTLKIPEFTTNRQDRIQSLIDSCCYLIERNQAHLTALIEAQMTRTTYSRH